MNVASIDIGSNTILLLIAEVDLAAGSMRALKNVHRMPRISKGLSPGQPISLDKIQELEVILDEYKSIIAHYKADYVIATATSPLRIASNADEIQARVRDKLNIDINIISGDEEAYYSFLGATSGISQAQNFLVIDIGGGSTEIISGSTDEIIFRKSFETGAVSATEKFLLTDPPQREHVEKMNVFLQSLFSELAEINFSGYFPVAIAGTPTTLSCIKNNMDNYDEKILELSTLDTFDLNKIAQQLSTMQSIEIKNRWQNIMRGREDIILAGTHILLNIMNLLKIDKVFTSTKGIRYGAVVNFIMNSKK